MTKREKVFFVAAAQAGKKAGPTGLKIWLPTAIVKKLRIKPGDRIRLQLQGRKAILSRAKKPAKNRLKPQRGINLTV